ALAVLVALAACGGKEERAKAHLERSRVLFAAAEYDKAGIELRNVLQIDPRSADAYHLSAQIWEAKSEVQKAFASYARAVERAPGDLEAKARMGRYYLFGGARDKAEEIAAEILAADSSDPHGRALKAALLAEKDPEAAAREARAVLESHPGDRDVSALLASLLVRGERRAAAATVLAESVEKNPHYASLRLALVSILEQGKEYAQAESQLRTLITQQPKRYEYRTALAALLARTGAADKSEAVLREAVKADPQDPRRVLALVDQIATAKGFDPAERELRGFIEARPKAHELRFGLANLYLNARRPEDAMQTYRDIGAADRGRAKSLRARGALARLLVTENRADQADPLIAEVLKENSRDNTALLLRAQRGLQRGDYVAAIADLRAVLRDQSDSAELTVLLARAHLANKEPELAQETLARAVQLHPLRPALRYAYASFLVQQGDVQQALALVDEELRRRADDPVALQAKAEIQAAAKD